MAYFHTKNPDLGIFCRALEWKMLVNFLSILDSVRQFQKFMAILYSLWSFSMFFRFGMFGPRKIWQPCS
jgi:hypothetical protein